jgi:hypothetical protein
MHRLVLTTDDVPEADRFSYWREAVNEGMIGITGERNAATPFSARISGSISASVTRFQYRADGFPVFRRPRDVARISRDDQILLYRENSEGACFNLDRREFVTRRGDLVVFDPTVPFATEARRNYDRDLLVLPACPV